MKSIELTKEHKSKLLEMCKVLFPEYNIKYSKKEFKKILIKEDLPYSEYKIQKPKWSIGTDGKIYLQLYYTLYEDMSYELIEIHWFEFCTTILFRRINYPKDIVNNSPLINVDHMLNSSKHPIEYLHSEFRKLK